MDINSYTLCNGRQLAPPSLTRKWPPPVLLGGLSKKKIKKSLLLQFTSHARCHSSDCLFIFFFLGLYIFSLFVIRREQRLVLSSTCFARKYTLQIFFSAHTYGR